MKKLVLLCAVLFLAIFTVEAQSPESFKYQTIVRDNTGIVLANKSVAFRISILNGSSTKVYEETHKVSTNSFGLANLEIGNGSNVSGSFKNINWGANTYFIQVELDVSGGQSYKLIGSSQLLSVPYALYANKSGEPKQTLSINDHQLSISDGNTITLPDNVDDADADATNELQELSKTGNTVSLSLNGGSFTDEVDDADNNPSNEIQALSYSNDTLYLVNGGWAYLGHLLDNTDNQLLDYSNDSLSIGNGNTVVLQDDVNDIDADTTNEVQQLTISNDTLFLTKSNPVVIPTEVPVGSCIQTSSSKPPAGYIYTGDYFITTSVWTDKVALPVKRASPASAVVDNKIYLIGGSNWGGTAYTDCYEYDPALNSWKKRKSMSQVRNLHRADTLNGKIYVVGGYANNNHFSSVEIYNPTNNTWSSGKNMNTARSLHALVSYNGKLYAIGGHNSSSNKLSSAEVFDPNTNSWTNIKSIPFARTGFGFARVNDEIYLIGGLNSTNQIISTTHVYNITNNTWSTSVDIPTKRSGFTLTNCEGKLYAIGGENSGLLSLNEAFNPNTDKWMTELSCQVKRRVHTSESVNGRIYIIAGYQDGGLGVLSSMEEYKPKRKYYIHTKE